MCREHRCVAMSSPPCVSASGRAVCFSPPWEGRSPSWGHCGMCQSLASEWTAPGTLSTVNNRCQLSTAYVNCQQHMPQL